MELGSVLRDLRVIYDYSLEEASHELGVSTDALKKIEDGRAKPSQNNLRQLAEMYSMPIRVMQSIASDDSELTTAERLLRRTAIRMVRRGRRELDKGGSGNR